MAGRSWAERSALRVRVRSPKPDEHLYWRGQTFASYTGRGWEEDPETIGPGGIRRR